MSKRAVPQTIEVGVTTTFVLLQPVSVESSVMLEPVTVLELEYPPPLICRKIFTVVIPLGRVHESETDFVPEPEVVEAV